MSFDELLIRHSSPTLAGIKPASLINLRFLEGGTDSIDSLKEKGLSFMLLTGQSGYPLLLVYRLSAINEILKSPVAKSLLEKNGYKTSEPEKALEHLKQRFLKESCPHEVGIFLGYPAEDVSGFIENKGKNAISNCMWKVYSDTERALALCERWNRCRKSYTEYWKNGMEITRLCVIA